MLPKPLKVLFDRIERAVVDLADHDDKREALHALRSSLSDIYALTEASPKVTRAVERVVNAGQRLADREPSRLEQPTSGLRLSDVSAAKRSVTGLANALAGTAPSRIAVQLGRGW